MIYGSVCSGIEAATAAWHPLGWQPAFFSEIEKFPSAVLKHHYPHVPNRGDMTKFKEWPDAKLDVLVGGTPCQSFSIAGLRKGLDDPRGNLMLTYLAIAARYRPTWLVWENVPGVLSSWTDETDQTGNPTGYETNDFDCFLGGLAELGYGFAYRILDAQFVGVPQRRRRVFVVGYLGDWRRAAAVLFERHSLSGNTPPSREKRKTAPTIPSRSTAGGGLGTDFDCDGGLQVVGSLCADSHPGGYSGQDAYTGRLIAFGGNNTAGSIDVATAVNAHGGSCGRLDFESEIFITHSLRGEGFDASEDETGRGTPLIPIAFDCKASGQSGFGVGEIASTMRSMGHANSHQNGGGHQAVAIPINTQMALRGAETSNSSHEGIGLGQAGDPAFTLQSAHSHAVQSGMQVRRLTPRECERLQGFPDDYTLIPGKAADGPRYKALGNSMAVPVMRWIGERIDAVHKITVAHKQEVAA